MTVPLHISTRLWLWGAPFILNDVVSVAPLQETLYVGLKDTRMQAFKLPLIMDAPSGAAVNDTAAAALDTLADGTLPGAQSATPLPMVKHQAAAADLLLQIAA